jgi:hypothetical protein
MGHARLPILNYMHELLNPNAEQDWYRTRLWTRASKARSFTLRMSCFGIRLVIQCGCMTSLSV